MAGTIRHDGLQRGRLPERVEHEVGDLVDRRLPPAPDVVRLAVAAVEHDRFDRPAVIEDVQPLAFVVRRRVQRKRLVVERARREVRDDLLGELVRAVVVRAVRDRDGQTIRLVVRAHGMVGPRLRRVVRRARVVGRGLGERAGVVEREVAVDLARRHVVEAHHASLAGSLQQRLRAQDVGAEEASRVEHGETVVRLGGEVDDHVDRLPLQHRSHDVGVADVCLHERDPGFDVGEVRAIPRVREQVEGDHVIGRVRAGPVTHEVRTDESRGAGDQDAHAHPLSALRLTAPAYGSGSREAALSTPRRPGASWWWAGAAPWSCSVSEAY